MNKKKMFECVISKEQWYSWKGGSKYVNQVTETKEIFSILKILALNLRGCIQIKQYTSCRKYCIENIKMAGAIAKTNEKFIRL